MYNVDTQYTAMVEALVVNLDAGRSERWMAAMAFWLGRQSLYNKKEYWFTVGAKILSEIPDAEREDFLTQLSKEEDTYMNNVGGWPDVPSEIRSLMDSWSPPEVEVDLEALKANAILSVDRGAERFRMNFITPGFGQVMAYQQKLDEARAKLANESIADSAIPHVVREADADGMTKTEKAQQIVDTFTQWQQLSAGIEGLRMGAKKAILEADSTESVNAAATVDWSSLQQ